LPYRQQKKIGCKIKNFASNHFEPYYSKLFDTNPLLRDKEILFNPRGAWKILIEFNLANRAAGAENLTHTLMLGLLDKLRTYFQKNPDSDL